MEGVQDKRKSPNHGGNGRLTGDRTNYDVVHIVIDDATRTHLACALEHALSHSVFGARPQSND